MNIQTATQQLINKQDLTAAEMTEVMQFIMSGAATNAQIAGFLIALHCKGESITEIVAATKVIRALALPVVVDDTQHLLDIVGTGGDKSHTFNISTACAFVAAAAGAKVAKHNNRAISSLSGSADLLEIAGINPSLNPAQIAECMNKIGVGFMFAPLHHTAWKHVSATRRELGIRTLFNMLGPLVNPAHVPNLLVGVSNKKWVELFAHVFQQLGNKHVLVVHSDDGLDEISIAAPTTVSELKNGKVKTYSISPELFSIKIQSIDELKVKNAKESFMLIESVFNNQPGPAKDIVVLNAGAAIYAANIVDNLEEGVKKADVAITSGAAKEKFLALVKLSQMFEKR